MPREQEEFRKSVEEVLKAAMFENWLRFYFLKEVKQENGEAVLMMELPEKSLEKIRELYPRLLPMAESLNNKVVDFESSRNAVLMYLLEELDGKSLAKGAVRNALESSAFQVRLQMFHAWVQLHEDQLDASFMDFGTWQKLFEEWAKSPAAIELGSRLKDSVLKTNREN